MSNQLELTKRDLRELRAMRDSRGWQLLAEAVQKDMLIVACGLADTPDMPVAEMHFRRGRISADRAFPSILDALIQAAETEVLMASADDPQTLPDQPAAPAA